LDGDIRGGVAKKQFEKRKKKNLSRNGGVSGIGRYRTPLLFMEPRNSKISCIISKAIHESRSEKSAARKIAGP